MIFDIRKDWRYQRDNLKPWFEEGDIYNSHLSKVFGNVKKIPI